MNISVIIPTYKASAFIRETLGSVFAQTRLPDEVIVVDDCSPDDTVAVVEQLASNAPVKTRVIRLSENSGGPTRPINVGIEAARGDLIATLDHDDLMLPDRLRLQAALCEQHPSLGLCIGAIEIVDQRQPSPAPTYSNIPSALQQTPVEGGGIISREEAHRSILPHGCYARSCSTMTFPKTAWVAVGGFDPTIQICADLAFLVRITRQFDIGVVDAAVATYFFRASSLYSSAHSAARTRDELQAYRQMDRRMLDRELRRRHDRLVSTLHADNAFLCRESGWYKSAAWEYLRSLRCRITQSALLGMAKLLPHWMLSQFKRGRAP